ncbi:unnamed protein product [Durusdinium trenchii]|uniref:Uncharacterized protein n=2 Tax=Durusdinium trenchii TaxID=1381693 RepID=A0ABP0JG57_9DINO
MAPKRAAATQGGPAAKVPKMPQLKRLTSSNKAAAYGGSTGCGGRMKRRSSHCRDRYGRGNGDTYAYNRVRSFISAFSKVLQAHLKSVEVSGQEDKIEEYVQTCYALVMDMHTFNDAKHNAARSRLKISLEKVAKKHGIDLGEGSEDGEEDESGIARPCDEL